jgi:hypothetical protein
MLVSFVDILIYFVNLYQKNKVSLADIKFFRIFKQVSYCKLSSTFISNTKNTTNSLAYQSEPQLSYF